MSATSDGRECGRVWVSDAEAVPVSPFAEAVRALNRSRTRQDGSGPTNHHAPGGLHAFVDLAGCDPETLNDAELLATVLVAGSRRAGATVRDVVVTPFAPQGCSVVVVLEESHASIHTYPEHGQCFIDAFTCGDVDPRVLLSGLVGLLNPGGGDTPAGRPWPGRSTWNGRAAGAVRTHSDRTSGGP